MDFKTFETAKPSKGCKMDPKSKVQLAGYVPSEKRVVDLLSAGLVRQAVADEWYDGQFDLSQVENLPPIPPLPRAFAADLAEVSELARIYRERAEVINERIRMAAAEGKLTLKKPATTLPVEPVAPPTEASKALAEGANKVVQQKS